MSTRIRAFALITIGCLFVGGTGAHGHVDGAKNGGQRMAATTEPLLRTSGTFFALSVSDLDASLAWYADKLGLRVVMRAPMTDGAAATVLQGGGLTVELVKRAGARPLGEAAAVNDPMLVHGIFKVGVVIDSYEKTLAMLKARSVQIALGPFTARGDQPANVLIRDNAGNLIQLFAKSRE
jgi:catechol 2,3-dioxygenase-like lactoylglutathione lyase family enzyme